MSALEELAPVVEALRCALGDDLLGLVLFGSRSWRWEKPPRGDWRIDWEGVSGIETGE